MSRHLVTPAATGSIMEPSCNSSVSLPKPGSNGTHPMPLIWSCRSRDGVQVIPPRTTGYVPPWNIGSAPLDDPAHPGQHEVGVGHAQAEDTDCRASRVNRNGC